MKSLLTALCLFVTASAFGANFPYIRLNNQTNRLSDSGTALTFNGSPVSVFPGIVSNSVVTSGLLAVGAGKTNGIAATASHINSTLGFTPASSNTLVTTYAPLASPALTGTPTINGASIQTELTNRVLKAGDTMTGTLHVPLIETPDLVVSNLTANSWVYSDANKMLTNAPFTPVNIAGDTMTGSLNITPGVNTSGLSITGYSKTVSNSVPMLNISGTWNNGTATNTALKINVTDTASGTPSLLEDLQVGGASKFSVNKAGEITSAGKVVSGNFMTASTFFAGSATSSFENSAGTGIDFRGNGIGILRNNAGSDWDRLQFGGTTASFPSIKRSSTNLVSRLADDSADTGFQAKTVFVSGTTNQVVFGATNTAPVNTSTPTKWISVQVSGESVAYRIPVFE